ncbi:E3 ubiquitin-protein ligase DZIP3-like isoform X2 [Hemitrygon akajei]|uniref:E3 ubiquitin-protein ligase DZIP3-like isoform X2 n=1 Tax=Hemitrygon akajei TaxID=2704970 RepID=UPI003BF9A119
MAREDCTEFLNDDGATFRQGPSAQHQPEDANSFGFKLEGEDVEEVTNSPLNINKTLVNFPSMSTDRQIQQFQVFLTAVMKNDLICRISQVQYLLLLHYFVMALCSRSKAQDLAEAKKQVKTIERMTKEKPECRNFLYVAYHTSGCLCYKQNRFEDAMQWFQKSKQEFAENPPNIEWSNVILKAEEIIPEYFEVKINEYIEKCTDPPDPIATCQHLSCQGYYKKEIYPSDPDYKGYVELSCDNNCVMQYHMTCWKKLRDSNYQGQSNQDFCLMNCINSGCKGIIIKLMIHSAAGSTQTEFEVKIPAQQPQLSTMKNKTNDTDAPEESSKCPEKKNTEMAKEGLHPFCSTVKCRLFEEMAKNRKLIENAICEIENTSELLTLCNLKEVLAEKSNKISAEIIVDRVLEWNCNVKIRRFLSLLRNQDISKHQELWEWLKLILELSDQCSLYFLFSYKKILIQVLNEAGDLVINIAEKLLSRKAVSEQELKILTAARHDQISHILMEQMITNKMLWQIGELVFLLAEQQDAIPKLKPLFEEFNQEFDKFGMTVQSKEAATPNSVLPALPPPQEIKEKVMESEDGIDDHSGMLKAKTKTKKRKKKSKSKKDMVTEDDHQTTQVAVPKSEVLSIPVQENQSNKNKGSELMANTICNVSTFGVIPPDSSFLVLHSATDGSRTVPSFTSHVVHQSADLPELTYQSDGELDDIDFIIKDSNVDLYSSPLEADGATKTQEYACQNSKGDSEFRQKLIDLETENKVLKKNSEHLMIQFKNEEQRRIDAESMISKQQEYYHQEISRLKQQLQRKEEEIKKVTAQYSNERMLWNKDKAKLEDVTAKNIVKLVEATKRAVAAEVLVLECRRDNGLFQLQQAEQDCTVHLKAAEENMGRNPTSASACATADGWQAIVADIRNKIDFTKNQFDEQIALLKSGTKLSILPQIKIPPPPPHPDAVMKHFLEQHLQMKSNYWQAGSGQSSSANGRSTVVKAQPEVSISGPEQIQVAAPASNQVVAWHTGAAARKVASVGGIRGKNSFERIMEKLSTYYPQFTRSSLTDYLKEVRLSNGGSLSGLSYDEIINKVAGLVESKLSARSNRSQNNPPQTSVWHSSRQQGFKPWEGAAALSEEDPCVICHEELTAESMLILPCAHKFHSQCIEPWLNEQRTCPTCRLHVVLPREFPDLPSRKIPPL